MEWLTGAGVADRLVGAVSAVVDAVTDEVRGDAELSLGTLELLTRMFCDTQQCTSNIAQP